MPVLPSGVGRRVVVAVDVTGTPLQPATFDQPEQAEFNSPGVVHVEQPSGRSSHWRQPDKHSAGYHEVVGPRIRPRIKHIDLFTRLRIDGR